MNDQFDNDFDAEMMAAAGRLATEVKPERDLWPGIEQAIRAPARPQRSAWNTVWAQAAAILLLVGGSSGLTYLAMSGNGDPATTAVTPVDRLFEPVSGSFGSRYHLGPDYVDAKRDLEAKLDEELNRLTPEARDAVQANMEAIRMAIAEINKALAEEPGNVLLQELLLSTYREELALMQHVDSIANAAMYRGDI